MDKVDGLTRNLDIFAAEKKGVRIREEILLFFFGQIRE